ncbi:MAG: methylmalonyl-CoA epimerase [Thermoplasmata archaeon]|nr:methylmalonyl-CoA epimerase [Thermoplasmata archaeon]
MIKIDHIGIAVKSIEDGIKMYEGLGLLSRGIETLEDEEVKVAIFDASGSRVELIESLYPDSTISRYIEKKGEGLHHIAFRVDNMERSLAMLAEIGIRPIDEVRRGVGGSKIVFLNPKNFTGVLIELVERKT